MKAYAIEKRSSRGGFKVTNAPTGCVIRPNRNAAGMQANHFYSKHKTPKNDDVLTLMVRGTLDNIRGLSYSVKTVEVERCGCCGQVVRKLRLNDGNKQRLRLAKKYRYGRVAA